MAFTPKRLTLALVGAGCIALAGCGGSDSSTTTGTTSTGGTTASGGSTTTTGGSLTTIPTTPSSVVLSGTAATGAALADASLKIYDATGAVVCEIKTGSDGAYSCDLGISPKPPFVLVATLDDVKLVSIAPDATTGTVNITPLTNLIASTLSSNGDPQQLVDDIKSTPASVDAAKVKASVDRVMAALKPLLDALGTQGNPITTAFKADGTGQDRLLDLLQVSVRPDGSGANNEVTVKSAPSASDSDSLRISFKSSDTTIAPLPTGSVSAESLGTDNVAVLVSDMLKRMTACYAVPLADRVTNGSATGSMPKSPACTSLFVDNDPARFLSNGATVSPTAAFKGMFYESGTGVAYDRGSFEFKRVNGDYVFSYRWTAADGSTDNENMVARKDGDSLKLIGNQYKYNATVRPYAQTRDLVNTPAFSSINTGYNIWIANRTAGGGSAVFSKVLVTTPKGNVVTYCPSGALSYLVIEKSATQCGQGKVLASTSVLRLAGRYIDPTNQTDLSVKEGGIVFVNPAMTDEMIASIPDQSVWKLEFFHADGVTPNEVQTYRTNSRAMTLAEVAASTFVDITAPARAAVIAGSSALGAFPFTAPDAASPNWIDIGTGGTDFWRVPSGALAPTSISAYGKPPTGSGPRFSDTTNVSTNVRGTVIKCSRQSISDTHCDTPVAVGQVGQYAVGWKVDALELWARSSRQVEISKLVGLYKLQ
ncbi:MAG: carboxypeptidase regulatory-like domain-containing protein [Burkholderiales bacterium]